MNPAPVSRDKPGHGRSGPGASERPVQGEPSHDQQDDEHNDATADRHVAAGSMGI